MAAKTSASSAFNSYFYQQQQQHASKQMDSTASAAMAASNAAISNDLLSDLHFKMLKKIAQLTKVIVFPLFIHLFDKKSIFCEFD